MCLSFTFLKTYQRETDFTLMLLHSFSTSAASLWLPRGEPVWRTLGRAPCQLLLPSRYQNGIETHWRAVACQFQRTRIMFSPVNQDPNSSQPCSSLPAIGWKTERYFAVSFQWSPNSFQQPQWGQYQEQVLLRSLLETHTQTEMQSSHRIQGLSQLLHKGYCHGLPGSLARYAGDPNYL